MGIFEKEDSPKTAVIKGPIMITYVNSKNKQEETVVKGSRAEKMLKEGRQWKVFVKPTVTKGE